MRQRRGRQRRRQRERERQRGVGGGGGGGRGEETEREKKERGVEVNGIHLCLLCADLESTPALTQCRSRRHLPSEVILALSLQLVQENCNTPIAV